MPPLLNELFSLDKKVVIVAGASRGIGAKIAWGMSQCGATTYSLARSKNIRPETYGFGESSYRSCDVTSEKQFKGVCQEIFNKHGTINVFIHSAGVKLASPKSSYSTEDALQDFDNMININLRTSYMNALVVSEYMKNSEGGVIIYITSIFGAVGYPGCPGYSASKGGLINMVRSLSIDFYKFGVRVNSIAPGYIKTDLTSQSFGDVAKRQKRLNRMIINRWGEVNDLLGAAIFLSSDASSYVTGQTLFVDGGWTAKGL